MQSVYSIPQRENGDEMAFRFVAANLGRILAMRELTQREFAKAVGVGQGTVSSWLSGRNSPRERHWPKILKALDCTMDDVMRDPSLPSPNRTKGSQRLGIPDKNLDAIVLFLRQQARELGYDLKKITDDTDD